MFFKWIKASGSLWWSLLKVQFQLMFSSWKLLKITPPIVSIFGGSRLGQEHQYAQQAFKFAQKLIEHDISIITGGGGGIMEAVNCGAITRKNKKARSIGINIKGLDDRNKCVEDYFELDFIFARKWLMTQYSIAFVIFPGGFGTLDELAEVLTLMQTKKLKRIPIILIGVTYWNDVMDWIHKSALQHELITKEDVTLFSLTDDLDHAFTIIRDISAKSETQK